MKTESRLFWEPVPWWPMPWETLTTARHTSLRREALFLHLILYFRGSIFSFPSTSGSL